MRDQHGTKNPVWKGDEAGYMAIHGWMYRNHPKTGRCEHCERTSKPTTYASINHTYTRERADWLELCRSCHVAFDGGIWNKGKSPNAETRAKMSTAAKARAERERATECVNGHPFDEANTYFYPVTGKRGCRACNRERARRRSQGFVPRPGI